jgi:hypothetical protein
LGGESWGSGRPLVAKIKRRREKSKRERADTKRHVKALKLTIFKTDSNQVSTRLPPSPKPNPWKPGDCSGASVRWPAGRGGALDLGSSWPPPRPYKGTTLSFEMAALQTGHSWRDVRVSEK